MIKNPNISDEFKEELCNIIVGNNSTLLRHYIKSFPPLKETILKSECIFSLKDEFLRYCPIKNLSLFHISAFFGSTECLIVLFNFCKNISVKTIDGYAPIHYAIFGGSLECVQFLEVNGANIKKDVNKKSPLLLATRAGSKEIINHLFDRGVLLSSTFEDDTNSPIVQALNHEDVKILKLLLKRGYRATCKESSSSLLQALVRGIDDAVELLLNSGSNPNKRGNNQELPLLVAIKLNKMKLVNMLLNYGADIHLNGKDDESAIHCAAKSGNITMIEKILSLDPDIKKTNHEGQIATFYALDLPKKTAMNVLDFLFKKELDINHVDKEGRTLLSVAIWNEESSRSSLKRGYDESSGVSEEDFINFLLRRGADPNFPVPKKFRNNNLTEEKSIFDAVCNDNSITSLNVRRAFQQYKINRNKIEVRNENYEKEAGQKNIQKNEYVSFAKSIKLIKFAETKSEKIEYEKKDLKKILQAKKAQNVVGKTNQLKPQVIIQKKESTSAFPDREQSKSPL